jgi:hypothetical protein
VLLTILLIILLLAALPSWGYHSYGYTPVGLIVLILILWLIFGGSF